mmetsp:Transcript_48077/g.55383  ORF Transcript_48077/g.55383 Transcript_48077/m.55383 type:complete len:130 (-) Transcript_48077:94-483(-)
MAAFTRKSLNARLVGLNQRGLFFSTKLEVKKWNREEYTRGVENPIPKSPQLKPFKMENPVISQKKYRWCSCGLSGKQPFCDKSHQGTSFLPIVFSIEEKTDAIHLCGCKLSSTAPFCDNETCVKLRDTQ